MKINKIIACGMSSLMVLGGVAGAVQNNPITMPLFEANAMEDWIYQGTTKDGFSYEVYAEFEEDEEGHRTNIVVLDTVITGYEGNVKDIVIPSKVDSYSVTTIGENAFCNNEFTSVSISDGIKKINDWAFSDSHSLKSVKMADSVVEMGGGVFMESENLESISFSNNLTEIPGATCGSCTSLTSITFPKNLKKLGGGAFGSCYSLTSVKLPEGLEILEAGDGGAEGLVGPFAHCIALTDVTLPSTLITIGNSSFRDCISLTEIKIPKSVKTIGGAAFDGTSLSSITVPEGVETIENSAFRGCNNLTSVTISKSVSWIGGSAFYQTPWLEAKQKENPIVVVNGILIDGEKCSGDVVISDNVTKISDEVFWDDNDIKTVVIPDGVTKIGDRSFWYCGELLRVYIPPTLIDIGDFVFDNCPNLNRMIFEDSIPDCIKDILNTENFADVTIQGNSGSDVEKYAQENDRVFETTEEEIVKGDANDDGTVTVADAVAILQYLANASKYPLTEQGKKNADVDGVAGVSGLDALTIQKYDAKVITEL